MDTTSGSSALSTPLHHSTRNAGKSGRCREFQKYHELMPKTRGEKQSSPPLANPTPETVALSPALSTPLYPSTRCCDSVYVMHLSYAIYAFLSLLVVHSLSMANNISSTADDTASSSTQEYSTPAVVFFWQPPRCFSQWTPSRFTIDGTSYLCVEQLFAAEKSRLFGDYHALQNIMRVSDPKLHKQYGHAVRNFDAIVWEHDREI